MNLNEVVANLNCSPCYGSGYFATSRDRALYKYRDYTTLSEKPSPKIRSTITSWASQGLLASFGVETAAANKAQPSTPP
ncbi:hypothetical protein J6590_029778 [Homalodisca vitripennis]|nr:hypothetical protein J6590_029778 [Homalodisca vitripennis]